MSPGRRLPSTRGRPSKSLTTSMCPSSTANSARLSPSLTAHSPGRMRRSAETLASRSSSARGSSENSGMPAISSALTIGLVRGLEDAAPGHGIDVRDRLGELPLVPPRIGGEALPLAVFVVRRLLEDLRPVLAGAGEVAVHVLDAHLERMRDAPGLRLHAVLAHVADDHGAAPPTLICDRWSSPIWMRSTKPKA